MIHYRSITSVIDETGDADEEREKQKENADLTKMDHQIRIKLSFLSSLLGKKT
jgi:predicted ATP-binding protein involved in virulence